MITSVTNNNTLDIYWNLVKHLSTNMKIDLITKLTQSLGSTATRHFSAKKYYGIWGDDAMKDQEFIDEIKSLRNFNNDIPEL